MPAEVAGGRRRVPKGPSGGAPRRCWVWTVADGFRRSVDDIHCIVDMPSAVPGAAQCSRGGPAAILEVSFLRAVFIWVLEVRASRRVCLGPAGRQERTRAWPKEAQNPG